MTCLPTEPADHIKRIDQDHNGVGRLKVLRVRRIGAVMSTFAVSAVRLRTQMDYGRHAIT